MQDPEHVPPYIPPELRRHIAQLCDRLSLARLCAVNRLWSAGVEPVLYRSVHLRLRRENASALRAFTSGLARSTARASSLRRLLIEHSGHENEATPDVLPALGALLRLPALANLVDLRLRGHDLAFQTALLAAAKSPERRFRLHTLYLSQRPVVETPAFVKDVLRAHASSLRVLGVQAVDEFLWSAAMTPAEDGGQSPDVAQALHADCVRFAFVRRASDIPALYCLALFVHGASTSNVAAVARSLAAEHAESGSPTPVEALQLEWASGCDRAELSRAFNRHFPRVTQLEILIRGSMAAVGLDLRALSPTVAPFAPMLQVLEITEYRLRASYSYAVSATSPARREFFRQLVDAGCVRLREVRFPDGYYVGGPMRLRNIYLM